MKGGAHSALGLHEVVEVDCVISNCDPAHGGLQGHNICVRIEACERQMSSTYNAGKGQLHSRQLESG